MKYAIRVEGGWLIHGRNDERVAGRHIERGWVALWTKRATAVALAGGHRGRVVRVYTAAEARDRRAAEVLIEQAERLRQGARSANAPEPSDLVAQLLARAEELSHCPCKGPGDDPGPHSKCCPLRDPNYVRADDMF